MTDGFASGPLTKYGVDAQGNQADVLFRIPEFDAASRQWYISAVEKGTATWSPVYVLSTGQDMAIAASRPVYDHRDKLVGVVSVDIFLSHIGYFLKHLKIGQSGQAFIIERSGLLIASSTTEPLFTGTVDSNTRSRLNAEESGNPLIYYSMRALQKQFAGLEGITEEVNIQFEIDGRRQYLQATPVRSNLGLDWLVMVVIPEADFMARINANNQTTGLLIFVALVAALLAGTFAAHRITRPILRVNLAARSLANGDRTEAIPDVTPLRELSVLTRSFNQMSGQLQQTMDELNLGKSRSAGKRRSPCRPPLSG